jgi:hypothetical protein
MLERVIGAFFGAIRRGATLSAAKRALKDADAAIPKTT